MIELILLSMQAFNLFFYAFYQHFLLLSLTNSAYLSFLARQGPKELNNIDLLASFSCIFFLALEAIADQQQYNFQLKKYALMATKQPMKGDFERGFLTTGLFRYSRHPNFFSEIMFWYSNYLFGVAATGLACNWTLVGPVLLNVLFLGSTWLTESLSCVKYQDYSNYQKTTSKLVPWFSGPKMDGKKSL